MLAKTSHVTYKIQRHAKAEPELHSWLHGEESDGLRIGLSSELPPEAVVSSPSSMQYGSLDFGLAIDQDFDAESDDEESSTSAIQPR